MIAPRVLAGRYEVGELIGRGGMAEVHIGHDNRLGRTVAIKILRSDLARDPSFLTRFRREAQAAAALNHPAIVAVYDTGEDTSTDPATGSEVSVPFIVMEYVEGHTVREILRDGEAVPIDEAVEITMGVLSALEYSHHAGIVHRDIKPANIMITPTGAVKVMDFGIARAVADASAAMTATHAVIGTAQYLSPEQARGEQVDARSDLYSTGCVLFELLTGRPPFQGDSPVAVAYQHVGQAAQKPSEIASDVPEALDRITLKALAKDRESRYGSAADFRHDLEAFARGTAVAAPAVVAPAAGAATQLMTPGMPAPVDGTQVMPAGAGPQWGPVGTGAPGSVVPQQMAPQVIYEDEEEGNSRKGLIATLITLAAVLVGGIIAIVLLSGGGNGEMAEVPAVPVGSTMDEARQIIEEANFEFASEVDEGADGAPNTSVRQDPEGGTDAAVGSVVTVWFTPDVGPDAVPELAGMSQEMAQQILQERGLEWGTVTSEPHAEIPENHVTRTDPPVGTVVEPGTVINIYVSDGTVELPDLLGMTEDEALELLDEIGLTGTVRSEGTADYEVGTVMRQTPEPGNVPQNQRVVIVIAEEMPIQQFPVPALAGRTWNDALSLCVNFDCARGADEESTQWPAGTVIRTEPGAGTMLDEGSRITVIVSAGPGPQAPCQWNPDIPENDPACVEPTPEPPPTDPGDGGNGGDAGTEG